jgi:hypothetical protein
VQQFQRKPLRVLAFQWYPHLPPPDWAGEFQFDEDGVAIWAEANMMVAAGEWCTRDENGYYDILTDEAFCDSHDFVIEPKGGVVH